jgi:hypothetical protein
MDLDGRPVTGFTAENAESAERRKSLELEFSSSLCVLRGESFFKPGGKRPG